MVTETSRIFVSLLLPNNFPLLFKNCDGWRLGDVEGGKEDYYLFFLYRLKNLLYIYIILEFTILVCANL
ncbi:hypothetical protein Mgra_00006714 [Meloidogyne graminicola]|uniref:Uncharacterized protein n=1 Tax=Meloidogyne graminicola TaxID=189291 RepID=A0A8S9ZKZ4_9BILA|nr:hypothetical protein Mgra_00006714 [Meloidogyne graminicola]